MSQANPFRRPAYRQYPLIAEAFVDVTDLLKGAPVLTSATAKRGISDVGDMNYDGIKDGTGSSLSGITFNLFELPAGAVPIGGDVKVLTAFNSSTSDVLIIGDAGDADRYTTAIRQAGEPLADVNNIDLQAATRSELVLSAYQASATTKVTAVWTGTGTAPTTGQFHVTLRYIIPGRSAEAQGT